MQGQFPTASQHYQSSGLLIAEPLEEPVHDVRPKEPKCWGKLSR